ncbi:KNOX transcription factor [Selaginella moellendorffii]|uniref:KNOX transcription factor n=1 Tax=Selaginella moellendorffii TaxID=88036 RepID=D8SY74_SELML|nr:homeobox protein knotted-1-like 10 isoform X1 [Selaginella moellendorffii]EFJ10744.1 KNOX transcription factor [Selaginella moellendorffii]|eukprot:XP_002988325.1 homeobox protein knotted-1-like 10 isoform X1 [Selaginella moellendorffii]
MEPMDRHSSPKRSPGRDGHSPFGAHPTPEQHDAFLAASSALISQACVKEDPEPQQQHHLIDHGAAAAAAMEHLAWDNHSFIESMSPESADLCKHLLEHIHGAHFSHGEGSRHDPEEQQPHHHHGGASSSSSGARLAPPPGSMASSISTTETDETMKASIVAHAHYPDLLASLLNIQKVLLAQVGAPPDRVAKLDEAGQLLLNLRPAVVTSVGANPELDDFMVAYCAIMKEFEDEFRNVLEGAMAFCKTKTDQLGAIAAASIHMNSVVTSVSDHPVESEEPETTTTGGGAEIEEDISSSEVGNEVDPLAKDENLKEYLAQRYGAYIKGLKQEFLKKKKKGKLPKHSTEKLYEWWEAHIKWPYPSEQEKANLATDTGLDQKQINNWFINQRKRHWNPSEHDRPLSSVSARGNTEG